MRIVLSIYLSLWILLINPSLSTAGVLDRVENPTWYKTSLPSCPSVYADSFQVTTLTIESTPAFVLSEGILSNQTNATRLEATADKRNFFYINPNIIANDGVPAKDQVAKISSEMGLNGWRLPNAYEAYYLAQTTSLKDRVFLTTGRVGVPSPVQLTWFYQPGQNTTDLGLSAHIEILKVIRGISVPPGWKPNDTKENNFLFTPSAGFREALESAFEKGVAIILVHEGLGSSAEASLQSLP